MCSLKLHTRTPIAMEYPHLVTSLCYPSCDCSVSRLVLSHSRKLFTRVVPTYYYYYYCCCSVYHYFCVQYRYTYPTIRTSLQWPSKYLTNEKEKCKYLDFLVPKHVNIIQIDSGRLLPVIIYIILYHAKSYLFGTAGNSVE